MKTRLQFSLRTLLIVVALNGASLMGQASQLFS
jgi:hypothetical protein